MTTMQDENWRPDAETIQWVLDRIGGLVDDRVSTRPSKKPLVSDETIAAVGNWIARQYARTAPDVPPPGFEELAERCSKVSYKQHGVIEQLFRDIHAGTVLGLHRNKLLKIVADKTCWGLPTTIDIYVEVTMSNITIDEWAKKFHGC